MSFDRQATLQRLFDAIIARASGKHLTQAGHKDKQASYSAVPLAEMIRLYRQLWFRASGLPELNELGQPVAKRGPVIRHYR